MVRPELVGPVSALRQGRRLLGLPPVQTVLCYAVDGLLIDTGLSLYASATLKWARAQSVRQVVVTHHHEDHSGGAWRLRAEGLPVRASRLAVETLAQGFPLPFYRRAVWGPAPQAARFEVLGQTVETARHRFTVLAAPGHSPDQMVLYEPGEGWLFAADTFLSRTLRYFRPVEDFAAHLATLETLTALDFKHLFCAHRPVLSEGREALRQKLQWWRDLEGRVRELAARDWPVRRIVAATLGRENWLMPLLTGGDVTRANLVRAILARA